MVASIRPLSSVDHAVKYFYYNEKELEAKSGWHESKATNVLELSSLRQEDFENILSGKITKDIELGQRTKDGIKHHPGHDLTFSAPKSVSIMGLVIKDARVLEAHERAVSKALDYLQRHLIHTRVQKDGDLKTERSDNALIAKFTHITSRPAKSGSGEEQKKPDPQLHTHCLIANATLCQDGVWRSVVFESVYDSKMLLGEIYRMELVRELALIGYELEITRTSKGRFMFEIKGVPKEDIDTFSSRRKDILREAEKRGVTDAVDMAQVALDTRASKNEFSREELQNEWESRLQSQTLLEELAKARDSRLKDVDKNGLIRLAIEYAINHLSNREAIFSEQSLHSSMIERLAELFGQHEIDICDIESTVKAGIDSGQLLSRRNSQDQMLTTPNNLREEKRTIKLMQLMLGHLKPIMLKRDVAKHMRELRDLNLSLGQKEAITLSLTTKDRVIGIQGSAGSRKTTTLDIIKDITKTQGLEMLGLAPTKAAVKVLKTHIPAHTLSYFIRRYEKSYVGKKHKKRNEQALKTLKDEFKNKIVVLDEASLASTWQVKSLLQLASVLKFRLIMVGDFRQLGAIQAGKPFYYLQENGMNTCVMGEIRRQEEDKLLKSVYLAESAVDKKEREAGKLIAKVLKNLGTNVVDISQASKASEDDEWSEAERSSDIAEAAYNTWSSLKDKDPLVVVPSHALREKINDRIRSHFISGSELSLGTLIKKDMTPTQMRYANNYAKGDVLRFGKDKQNLGIKRGNYFLVEDIKENVLILKQGEKTVGYNLAYESAIANLEVYEPKSMKIASGDRIRWTRNSQKHDFVVNGNSFTIKSIQDNKIEFEADNSTKSIELSDPDLQHIDYDYTSTVYGVQGRSKEHVLGVTDSRLNKSLVSQRSFYVMLSRAKHGVTLVTNDAQNLMVKLSKSTGDKTSALEHQQGIDNAPNTINLSKAKREFFKPDIHEDKRTNIPSRGSVTSKQFIKDKNLMLDVAVSLFGKPTKTTSTTLTFQTDFKFKTDKYDFWRDNLVSVDLETGNYYRLNNIEEEETYRGSLYKLAQEEGLFNTDEQLKKIAVVEKLLSKSKPIRGTMAEEYLTKHRMINTDKIQLSEDVRFISKAYSSDTKSYHPTLLVIGRDNGDNIRSAQLTYLNSKTQNKDKTLPVVKRSMGALKGSFIELTRNKDARDVFIAEGVETALSIASVAPEARVICSLGSSNLQHIDLGKGKNIVICADNDWTQKSRKPPPSLIAVEKAAREQERRGNSVTVIMPDQPKTDFNDVLKAAGEKGLAKYVEPVITKGFNYKKAVMKLEQTVAHKQQGILSAERKLQKLDVYKHSAAAIAKLDQALNTQKLKEVLNTLKTQPETFGELKTATHDKEAAIRLLTKHAKSLALNKTLLKTHQAKLGQMTKAIKDKIKLTKFDTKDKGIEELEQGLEREVKNALKVTDNICDFTSVKKVTRKIAEQILHLRDRVEKEPTAQDKINFFLRARYELERKAKLKKQLTKMYSSKALSDKMLLAEKLERASAIDSRLADKDGVYYKPAPFIDVRSSLKQGDTKILSLKTSIINKGIECAATAEFIAKETVKYEEKHGMHTLPGYRDTLHEIGGYVSRGHRLLLKNGFAAQEALRIMHKEGASLALYHNKRASQLCISEPGVQKIQRESKQSYTQSNIDMSCKARIGSKSIEIELR